MVAPACQCEVARGSFKNLVGGARVGGFYDVDDDGIDGRARSEARASVDCVYPKVVRGPVGVCSVTAASRMGARQ